MPGRGISGIETNLAGLEHGLDVWHAERATTPAAERASQIIQPAAVLVCVGLQFSEGDAEAHAAINSHVEARHSNSSRIVRMVIVAEEAVAGESHLIKQRACGEFPLTRPIGSADVAIDVRDVGGM